MYIQAAPHLMVVVVKGGAALGPATCVVRGGSVQQASGSERRAGDQQHRSTAHGVRVVCMDVKGAEWEAENAASRLQVRTSRAGPRRCRRRVVAKMKMQSAQGVGRKMWGAKTRVMQSDAK